MRSYPIESIPEYAHAHDVPLNLSSLLPLDPYIGNNRRWVRDRDVSARIREHSYHASVHDVYFWLFPVARRSEYFLATGGGDDVFERCVPFGPRILGVPASHRHTWYAGLVCDVRREIWVYSTGRFVRDDSGKQLNYIISTQLLTVGYAQAMYRAVRRFLCSALSGAAYSQVYSALYCYWERFLGLVFLIDRAVV